MAFEIPMYETTGNLIAWIYCTDGNWLTPFSKKAAYLDLRSTRTFDYLHDPCLACLIQFHLKPTRQISQINFTTIATRHNGVFHKNISRRFITLSNAHTNYLQTYYFTDIFLTTFQ
jgi:hypothetical protein